MLEFLAQNHGFVDGNKRTALLVTLLMIERSGYHVVLLPDERIDDLVVAVAEKIMTVDTLVLWFASHLARHP